VEGAAQARYAYRVGKDVHIMIRSLMSVAGAEAAHPLLQHSRELLDAACNKLNTILMGSHARLGDLSACHNLPNLALQIVNFQLCRSLLNQT